MSKELTEKFMNDELDDRLYYFTQKMSQDNVEIGHSFAFNMVRADDGEYLDWFLIHEVLAPVPSYSELCELKQELEICKDDKADLYAKLCNALMQLEEANKVIKKYGQFNNWEGDDMDQHCMTHFIGEDIGCGWSLATDYLERYGVK
jgi:hypothetical protein